MSGKKHRNRNAKLQGPRRIAPRLHTFTKDAGMSSTPMGEIPGMGKSRTRTRSQTKQTGKRVRRGGSTNSSYNSHEVGTVRMAPRVGALGTALFAILVGASGATPANALPESRLRGMTNTLNRESVTQVHEFSPEKTEVYAGSVSRAGQLERKSKQYETGKNSYEIPLGDSPHHKGERNSLAVSINEETQSVSVRPVFRKGSDPRAYPNGKPFSLGYSHLGIKNPQLLIEEGETTITLCLFDYGMGAEARFGVNKDSPNPDSSTLRFYQEYTKGYFSSVAGSLEKLPKFGAGGKKGKFFSTFLAKLHVKAVRELRKIAPNPEEYPGGKNASEESRGQMLDDFIVAYEDIAKYLWKIFVSEATKSRGQEKRKDILEHGKRLIIALMCRPYAIHNSDLSALGELDSLIGRGVPDDEFMQFVEDNGYTKIYDAFSKELAPQMKVLLGAGFHEASNR